MCITYGLHNYLHNIISIYLMSLTGRKKSSMQYLGLISRNSMIRLVTIIVKSTLCREAIYIDISIVSRLAQWKQSFIGLATYNGGGGASQTTLQTKRSCRFWGATNFKNTIAIFPHLNQPHPLYCQHEIIQGLAMAGPTAPALPALQKCINS